MSNKPYRILRNLPNRNAYGQYYFNNPETVLIDTGITTKTYTDDLYTTVENIDEKLYGPQENINKYVCISGDGSTYVSDTDDNNSCISMNSFLNTRPITNVTINDHIIQKYYSYNSVEYNETTAPNKVMINFDLAKNSNFKIDLINDDDAQQFKNAKIYVMDWGDGESELSDNQVFDNYKNRENIASIHNLDESLHHLYQTPGLKTIKIVYENNLSFYTGACPLYSPTYSGQNLYQTFTEACEVDGGYYDQICGAAAVTSRQDFCSISIDTVSQDLNCGYNGLYDCEYWNNLNIGSDPFYEFIPQIKAQMYEFKHKNCDDATSQFFGSTGRLQTGDNPYICQDDFGGNQSDTHGCLYRYDGTYVEPDGHYYVYCNGTPQSEWSNKRWGSAANNSHTWDVGCHETNGTYDPNCFCVDNLGNKTGATTYGGCVCGFICQDGMYEDYPTLEACNSDCSTYCTQSNVDMGAYGPYIGYDYHHGVNDLPDEEYLSGYFPFYKSDGSQYINQPSPSFSNENTLFQWGLKEYAFKHPWLWDDRVYVSTYGQGFVYNTSTGYGLANFKEYFCGLNNVMAHYDSKYTAINNTKLITIKLNINTDDVYGDEFTALRGGGFKFLPELYNKITPIIGGISENSKYFNDVQNLYNKRKDIFNETEKKDLQFLTNAYKNDTLGNHVGNIDIAQTRFFKGAYDMDQLLMVDDSTYTPYDDFDYWCGHDYTCDNVTINTYPQESCVGLIFITDSISSEDILKDNCMIEFNFGDTQTDYIIDTSGKSNIGIVIGDYSINKTKHSPLTRDDIMLLPDIGTDNGAF